MKASSLITWVLTRTIFLFAWVWIGAQIKSKVGLAAIVPFALIIGLFQVLDLWNQCLISKTIKALKEQIREQDLQGKEKERNIRKVQQLEVKRSIFTALPYFFSRAGFGRTPKFSQSEELLDFAPGWVKAHVLKSMAILSPLPFLVFLPAIKATIRKSIEDNGVFIGLDTGSGDGRFIEMIARWCQKQGFPVVFFGIENQDHIVKAAFQRMKARNSFEVLMYSEDKINMRHLTDKTKAQNCPIVCFISGDATKLLQYFEPGSITMTQVVHAKHHFEGILGEVDKVSKHWIILEEPRSWFLLFVIYAFYWFASRILICDGEDSILSMHTLEEWRDTGVKAIAKPPFFLWIMSNDLFTLLKREGIVK